MSENYVVGVTTYQVSGMSVTDNYMPIELTWDGLLSDAELNVMQRDLGMFDLMPVIRKNYKDAQMKLMAKLDELDQLDALEKSRQRWQDSLLIRVD